MSMPEDFDPINDSTQYFEPPSPDDAATRDRFPRDKQAIEFNADEISDDSDSEEALGVIGDYELIKKLGYGGFGRVFKAKHTTTGDIVAIKILRSALTETSTLLKRLRLEFEATMRLNHPNIANAFAYQQDGFENSWMHFLVMEFVDGQDLRKWVKSQNGLSYNDAKAIIGSVASALDYAHAEGFIHRDVKPSNILLTNDGQPKVSDFGLVKSLDPDLHHHLTRTGERLGTLAFMPPEQLRDTKSVDHRCDVYALALTFYVMLCNGLPFHSKNAADWQQEKTNDGGLNVAEDEIPSVRACRSALLRSLRADRNERYDTCAAFVADLPDTIA